MRMILTIMLVLSIMPVFVNQSSAHNLDDLQYQLDDLEGRIDDLENTVDCLTQETDDDEWYCL